VHAKHGTIAKRIVIGLILFLGTLLVLTLYLPGLRHPTSTVTGTAAIGGPFTLVDTKGNTVTEAVLNGHYSLVYFGYTYCPDICPLALQNMTQALEIAGPVADDVVPVFITIDPERDTPQVMADYIGHFHPRMIGLTGTPEQVSQAEQAYRVYAAKAGGTPGKNDYLMNHSGFIYLMDKNGKYVTHFTKDVEPKVIAGRIRRELSPQ
jgi:protein SCO1/2